VQIAEFGFNQKKFKSVIYSIHTQISPVYRKNSAILKRKKEFYIEKQKTVKTENSHDQINQYS
jgi:hypothetical protein